MTRVRAVQGFQPLQLGLGVLLALMVLMSGWLGRTLVVWGRHVRGIEEALRMADRPECRSSPGRESGSWTRSSAP